MRFYPVILALSLLSYSNGGLCYDSVEQKEPYPAILKYQDNPLPEQTMNDFLSYFLIGEGQPGMEFDLSAPFSDEDEEGTAIEWQYLGDSDGHHVLRGYVWPNGAMGKFSGLIIFKREGDKLLVTDMIYGGDRHSSMLYSAVLTGNQITYYQNTPSASFVEVGVELFPELKPVYEKSSRKGLCYGEACFAGSFEYQAVINSEGKIDSMELISYTPPEGTIEHKDYAKDELKDLVLATLQEIEEEDLKHSSTSKS